MRKTALIIIPLIMFLTTSSNAQEQSQMIETMPVGLANQGGYTFHYQSGKGQDCRGYWCWNTPGRVRTPVLWRDDRETFLEGDLLRCPRDSIHCDVLEAIKISKRPTMIGKTTLSYGINRDEHKDEPDAYRKKPEEVTKFGPFTTILRGTVADAQDKPLKIGIRVSSYVNGMNPYRLTYVMEIVGESVPLQIFRPENVPTESLVPGLVWEAAASTPFFEYLDRMEISELSAKVPKIVVDITANQIELDESKLLVVVQGGKRIAATTAPSYRPMTDE